MKQQKNTGSYFFNYKGTFSIVFMALVDTNYEFIYVDIGCNGRISDGRVFRNCSLSKAIEHDDLNIPPPQVICEEIQPLPYVIVADDAFHLKENIMKYYPLHNLSHEKIIFNFHLSRSRRIVENTFGILASRFRIFLSPMHLAPENSENVTLASCVLHNVLPEKAQAHYTPPGSFHREDEHTGSITE